jgi:hypothetical protein
MSDFRKLRMTAKGRELLALAHQGVELLLLNIVVGNGAWSQENQEGDPPVALVSQKKVLSVSAIEQSGEVAQVRGMLTNTSMTQGFAITEIGVTAQHPVDGEILYMADYCELAKSSYIPDNSGAPVEIPLSLDVLVASSQEVTLQINDRFFSATKQDIDDHDAEPDAHQPLVDRLHASQPAITSPTPGALDVIETPTFQSAAFESHFAGVAHSHSQWQVETAAGDWTAPVHDSGADAVNLESYTLPSDILVVSTIYKVRVRHRCGPDGLWSEWSDPITFTTRDVFTYVAAPTNQNPGDGATDIGETPMLQGAAFQVVGGSDSHLESEFRILQGGSVVHTSTGLGAVTSYNVPQGVLVENTSYSWQCRYRGTSLGWGEWSAATGFTTMFAFIVGDDAVTYDPTLAVDYVVFQNLDTSTGSATADGGQGFFDTESQGEGEGDWSKVTVESDVRDPEGMSVDPGSTTSSLVLTSPKSGLLTDGDKILVNDGAAGAELIEVAVGSVVFQEGGIDWEYEADTSQQPNAQGWTITESGCTWAADGGVSTKTDSQGVTKTGWRFHVYTYPNGLSLTRTGTPARTGTNWTMEFWAFAEFNTTCQNYLGISDGAHILSFNMRPPNGYDVYTGSGYQDVASFPVNTWHKIKIVIDWTALTFDFYKDDVLVVENWSFSGSTTTSNEVRFHQEGYSSPNNYHVSGIKITQDGSVNPNAYTCTSISPALAAEPDKVFLPAPLYLAHGDGTRILRPDAKVDFTESGGIVQENVQGSVTQLMVDTADTSGHFNTAKGSRVLTGCRIILEGGAELAINSITGDGTGTDAMTFSGTVGAGTYAVTAIHGTAFFGGQLQLSEAGGTPVTGQGYCATKSIPLEYVADIAGVAITESSTGFKRYLLSLDGSSSFMGYLVQSSTPIPTTEATATANCFVCEMAAASGNEVGVGGGEDETARTLTATGTVGAASGGFRNVGADGYLAVAPALLNNVMDGPKWQIMGKAKGCGGGSDWLFAFEGQINGSSVLVGVHIHEKALQMSHPNETNTYEGYTTAPVSGEEFWWSVWADGTNNIRFGWKTGDIPTGWDSFPVDQRVEGNGLGDLTGVDWSAGSGVAHIGNYSTSIGDAWSLDADIGTVIITKSPWIDYVYAWETVASAKASDHSGADGAWRYKDSGDAWNAAYVENSLAACSQASGEGMASTSSQLEIVADADWPDVSGVTGDLVLAVILQESGGQAYCESAAFTCEYSGGRGDFLLAALAAASWIDDAGTMVVTETSAEIEPATTFRGVAMGITELPTGAQISTPKINTWKQGA